MSDEDLTLKFGAEIDKLVDATHQVKDAITDVSTHAASITDVLSSKGTELEGHFSQIRFALQGLENPVRAIRENLGQLAEGFAAAFAIEKIEAFVEKMAQLNSKVETTATLLGTSTSNVAALGLAARGSGISLEGITFAFERLGMALARSHNDSSQAAASLKALGIPVKEFEAMDFDKKLQAVAEKISLVRDGSDKAAIMMGLFGRAGAAMIPMLNEGAEGFKNFQAMAERTGTKSFPEFEAAASQLHKQTIELSAAFDGASMRILTAFQPALSGLYNIMIHLVEGFTNSVREGGAFKVMLEGLAIGARAVAVALVVAVAAMETLWTVTKTAVFAIGESFMSLGRLIKDVFTFNWGDLEAAWGDLGKQLNARAKITAGEMEGTMKFLMTNLKTIFKEGADEQVKIEQTKNSKLDLAGKDRLAAAMVEIQNRIKLADMEYQAVTTRIRNEYGDFFFNEHAKTQALLDALNERHSVEMTGMAQELALQEKGTAAYAKILAERKVLDAKYAMDRQKIIDDAAKAEERTWNSVSSTIQGAFNSQLRGLLAGTTSWSQAIKSMLGDLVIKAIEYFEKMALEWIIHEAVKTTATTSGTAARAAAEAAGEAASLPQKIAIFTSEITADAARTFGGIFAFLSPVMGPAAAGPAAAGEASVLAQMAAVPKFDVGTNLVTKTGFAMIHENEAIVPAESNGPFSGGGGVTVNIHAVDAQSIRNLLMNNKPIVGQIINRLARDNPTAFGRI